MKRHFKHKLRKRHFDGDSSTAAQDDDEDFMDYADEGDDGDEEDENDYDDGDNDGDNDGRKMPAYHHKQSRHHHQQQQQQQKQRQQHPQHPQHHQNQQHQQHQHHQNQQQQQQQLLSALKQPQQQGFATAAAAAAASSSSSHPYYDDNEYSRHLPLPGQALPPCYSGFETAAPRPASITTGTSSSNGNSSSGCGGGGNTSDSSENNSNGNSNGGNGNTTSSDNGDTGNTSSDNGDNGGNTSSDNGENGDNSSPNGAGSDNMDSTPSDANICAFPAVLSYKGSEDAQKTSESAFSTESSDSCGSAAQKKRRPNVAAKKATAGEMTEGELQIIRDLKQLTLKERQKINREVDGSVIDVVHETPELISTSLQALESELVKMRSKKAYDFALFISPRHVKNAKFRIMFLRSEKFHIRKAAKRMVAYFEFKMELFGQERITRDITLFDMTDDDREALYSGGKQAFPGGRDKSGRIIIWDCIAFRQYKNPKNHLRMLFYLLMKIIQSDERAQIKGMIVVGYIVNCLSLNICDMELNQQLTTLTKAIPIRIGAFHLCFDNPVLKILLSTILMAFPKDIRVRHRSHFGSHMEVQYDITSNFGIPNDCVPVDQNGILNCTRYHDWLSEVVAQESISHALSSSMQQQRALVQPKPSKRNGGKKGAAAAAASNGNGKSNSANGNGQDDQKQQRRQNGNSNNNTGNAGGNNPDPNDSNSTSGTISPLSSSASASSSSSPATVPDIDYIDIPRLQDVLLGRGKPYRSYPGNCKLRAIVTRVQDEYDRVNKSSKTLLAMGIVMEIKESGGRFLSRADDENMGWVLVGDEAARTKVAQSFRNNRINKGGDK